MNQYEPFTIVINFEKEEELYIGVVPISVPDDKKPDAFKIIVNSKCYGEIYYSEGEWASPDIEDKDLVDIIGTCIYKLYDKGDRIFKKLVPEKFSDN